MKLDNNIIFMQIGADDMIPQLVERAMEEHS